MREGPATSVGVREGPAMRGFVPVAGQPRVYICRIYATVRYMYVNPCLLVGYQPYCSYTTGYTSIWQGSTYITRRTKNIIPLFSVAVSLRSVPRGGCFFVRVYAPRLPPPGAGNRESLGAMSLDWRAWSCPAGGGERST